MSGIAAAVLAMFITIPAPIVNATQPDVPPPPPATGADVGAGTAPGPTPFFAFTIKGSDAGLNVFTSVRTFRPKTPTGDPDE